MKEKSFCKKWKGVTMEREFCPEEDCGFQVVRAEGCVYCPACGWSECNYITNQKEDDFVQSIAE